MVKVYTSNIRYKGENRLDVTVKSGDSNFAPNWNMVMGYKRGDLTEDEYTQIYYQKMRKSYKENRKRWDEILKMDRVVFVCYCRSGDFCHRLLLAEIFEKLGAEQCGEIEV